MQEGVRERERGSKDGLFEWVAKIPLENLQRKWRGEIRGGRGWLGEREGSNGNGKKDGRGETAGVNG